jgi:hypothetical protein
MAGPSPGFTFPDRRSLRWDRTRLPQTPSASCRREVLAELECANVATSQSSRRFRCDLMAPSAPSKQLKLNAQARLAPSSPNGESRAAACGCRASLKRSGHACCLNSYPARHEDFATGFQDAVLSPRSLGTVLLSEPTTIAHVMARHEGCPVPIWLPTFVEAGIPWALRYLRDLRRDRPHRRTRRLATIGANRLQSRHFQRVAGASCPVIAGVALEAFGPLLGQSADLRSRQLRLCIGREAGVPGRGPACL